MNKNDIWNLFKNTGNINYYLKFKELQNKGIDKLGNNESKGNSIK